MQAEWQAQIPQALYSIKEALEIDLLSSINVACLVQAHLDQLPSVKLSDKMARVAVIPTSLCQKKSDNVKNYKTKCEKNNKSMTL